MSIAQARISVRVQPNAPRSEVSGFAGGVLLVRVAAAPVQGKANRELIALLGKTLGVSRGSLTVIRGHTNRNKVIAVAGMSQEEVSARLAL